MTTTVVKSVGSAGGRDYANVSAFLSAVPLNLITADQVWKAELYNDSEFSGNLAMSHGIWTTDATRYIWITAAAGQSFQDNASVRTNPLIYDQSKGVGWTLGASDGFSVDTANTRIERLQIKRTAANGGLAVANNNVGAADSNITFKDCIIQKENAGSAPVYQQYGANYGINLAIIDIGSGTGVGVQFGITTSTLLNCTVVQSTANSPHGVGINSIYTGSLVIRNCAVFGFTSAWTGVPGGTTDYNCSDGTCLTGSNNQDNKTYANQFESTTGDFRIKTGSDCIAHGNTDAALAPKDISNFTRALTTSGTISAWEYGTSGGTLSKVQGIAVASVSKLDQIAYASIKAANGLTTGN